MKLHLRAISCVTVFSLILSLTACGRPSDTSEKQVIPTPIDITNMNFSDDSLPEYSSSSENSTSEYLPPNNPASENPPTNIQENTVNPKCEDYLEYRILVDGTASITGITALQTSINGLAIS